MKTAKSLKAFCLFLAALIVSAAFPMFSLADAVIAVIPSTEDQVKLYEFWHQPAYDGMNNGEACYVYQFPEGSNHLSNPEYQGSWYTGLLDLDHVNGYRFAFEYELWYSIEGPDGECADGFITVTPDIYGELDLSETGIIGFGTPGYPGFSAYPLAGQTHITNVSLDGCYQLETIIFNGQEFCTQFSAVGCPMLNRIQLLNGAFSKIAFDLLETDETLYATAFGRGSVGAEYSNGAARLIAYPENDTFVGWFKEGVLVSSELEFEVTEGGVYRACFGGDADGSGTITVSDAITALRMSMGIASLDPNIVDINGNGTVDVSDAIMILRFAMGVL